MVLGGVGGAREFSFDRRPLSGDFADPEEAIRDDTEEEQTEMDQSEEEVLRFADRELLMSGEARDRRPWLWRLSVSIVGAAAVLTVACLCNEELSATMGYNAGKLFIEADPKAMVGFNSECRRMDLNGNDVWCCTSGSFSAVSGIKGQGGSASCSPYCFPGEATVQTLGRGAAPIAGIEVGDSVLVEQAPGKLAFEPVIGWLHTLKGQHDYVRIVHEDGVLRASATHLLFVMSGNMRTSRAAGDIRVGDRVITTSAAGTTFPSDVLQVSREVTNSGMYAPLTPSGTLVIDGGVASVYAQPSLNARLPHSAAHAAFFAARFGHIMFSYVAKVTNAASWSRPASGAGEEISPLAKLYFHRLRLDRLLLLGGAWTPSK